MRKHGLLSFALAVLFTALGANAAQEKTRQTPPPSREAGEQRAFGTILSVGVDRFEIKRLDGSTQTIFVDAQSRYRQGEQEIQLEDLKAGDRVMVRGRPDTNKDFVAAVVRRMTDEELQRFQNAGERTFGEIVSIDKNQIKVRNPRQGERTVVVNDQTEFLKQGQPITLKDLKVGDRIFALGKETQGQFVATRVLTGQFRGPGPPRTEQQP
jgi:hypothetical protein